MTVYVCLLENHSKEVLKGAMNTIEKLSTRKLEYSVFDGNATRTDVIIMPNVDLEGVKIISSSALKKDFFIAVGSIGWQAYYEGEPTADLSYIEEL